MHVKPGKRATCGTISCLIDGQETEFPKMKKETGKKFSYRIITKVSDALSSYCRKNDNLISSIGYDTTLVDNKINLQFKATTKKNHSIEAISFKGNEILDDVPVSNILALENLSTRTELVEAQKRLIKAGQFSFVALHTEENKAEFELKERNRYDLDYGIGWSTDSKSGVFVQFKDRMFSHAPHDFVGRLEINEIERRLGAHLQLRHLSGLPGDLFFTAENYIMEKPTPAVFDDNSGQITTILAYPNTNKLVAEFRYPINKKHRLQFGLEHKRTQTRIIEETIGIDEQGELLDTLSLTASHSKSTLTPIKISWAYENLNNYMLPRSGMMASLGLDYFHELLGTDNPYLGTRLAGNFTYFKSLGSWLVQQRLKFGSYIPNKGQTLAPVAGDPVLFYLGGGHDLRGYNSDSIGPRADGNREGIGGQAMLFVSTELTYLTQWYGFGISPFLDGGQVWRKLKDWDSSDLVWSTGAGLVFDTSFGYFRLDYVHHLDHSQPKELEKKWHFRIGRVF